jgi:hypothetical protein
MWGMKRGMWNADVYLGLAVKLGFGYKTLVMEAQRQGAGCRGQGED